MENLLLEEREKLFIPDENVAILQEFHPLDHALLVLMNVQYSVIPVTDKKDRVVGLISIPMILKKVMGSEEITFQELHQYTVSDVMNTVFPIVKSTTDVEDVLNALVDHNFLCIANEQNIFKGIITRKEILKRINYMLHTVNRDYTIQEIKETILTQQEESSTV